MEINPANADGSSYQSRTGSVEFPYRQQSWYATYMDALFESNRTLILQKIRDAEQLILLRERELLADPSAFADSAPSTMPATRSTR